jgi:hypothetical protein
MNEFHMPMDDFDGTNGTAAVTEHRHGRRLPALLSG